MILPGQLCSPPSHSENLQVSASPHRRMQLASSRHSTSQRLAFSHRTRQLVLSRHSALQVSELPHRKSHSHPFTRHLRSHSLSCWHSSEQLPSSHRSHAPAQSSGHPLGSSPSRQQPSPHSEAQSAGQSHAVSAPAQQTPSLHMGVSQGSGAASTATFGPESMVLLGAASIAGWAPTTHQPSAEHCRPSGQSAWDWQANSSDRFLMEHPEIATSAKISAVRDRTR